MRQASLSDGVAGVALFAASVAGADASWTTSLLDHAIDVVSDVHMPPTLFGGFIGVALAIDQIAQASEDDDANDDVDAALFDLIRSRAFGHTYELVSGLAGAGAYTLGRLPRATAHATLDEIVATIEELAEPGAPSGITWRTDAKTLVALTGSMDESAASGFFNLGIAHGIAGLLSLLGMIATTSHRERALSILSRAVPWFLEQEVPGRERAFGGAITSTKVLFYGRPGWCYGDLGKAMALLNAAHGADRQDWLATARRLLSRCADASRATADIVEDLGICHGTAGFAHLFNRAYRSCSDEALADAARFWLRRTLDCVERLHSERGVEHWIDDASLMTGAAGIGLVLSAAIDDCEPTWDRALLIAPRGTSVDPVC